MTALRPNSGQTAAQLAQANRRVMDLASDRAVHRAFHWLHLHETQLRRWQLEFLAIPAPPFGEDQRAAWFLERFRELGLHNVRLDAAGNALAELPGSSDQQPPPTVLLSAHLDTVFPAGTDCTPREVGPHILCPGATDNGAGLTALLALIAALRYAELQPAATLLLAANVGEEGPGDLRGMRRIFADARLTDEDAPRSHSIQAAIALEGAGTASVVDRALGSRRLRITVRGPGGHSWADAGRPNPILALADALHALESIALPQRPRTTLNVGRIEGGTSVNSIPETASAELDLRSVSAMELDRVELAVLRTLTTTLRGARYASHDALDLHIERIGNRPSGALPPSSPLAISLQAVDRHLGLHTELRIGSTDANLPLSLGIPALAIGAGGTGWGLHTLQEGYDPTGRELALRRVLLLLLDTCTLAAQQAASPGS
jgi:acetylornithine deacetylase/succinyl-diaminopimelate desuccinylase-like protein